MKDLIWTIIGIWFVYRIISFFRYQPVKRSSENQDEYHSPNVSSGKADKGEYIDFEEIKGE
jgi:hypothetical protein